MSAQDYRFMLCANDQFGPNGPQTGARGIAKADSWVEVDDEDWWKCHFPGYDGWYFLPERMMSWL